MSDPHPTRFWRTKIRPEVMRICSVRTTAMNDDLLLSRAYTTKTEFKEQQRSYQKDDQQRISLQLTISLISIFLLSYGDKYSAIDIIDGIALAPEHTPKAKIYFIFSQSLSAMLPLPRGIRPIEQLDTTRVWISTNMNSLQWDEKAEQYYLPNEGYSASV